MRNLSSKFLHTSTLIILSLSTTVQAGMFFNDFSSPALSGFTLNGGTRADGVTPYPAIENGYLALTYNENNLQGTIVLDDLDAGGTVGSFNATFKMREGGGSSPPADGFCFHFGSDIDASANFGEEGPGIPGAGNTIDVCFDIYDNGNAEAPAIDVKVNGEVVAHTPQTIPQMETGAGFANAAIQLTANGFLNVSYKDVVIYSNLFLDGYAPVTAGHFAIGARTGGLNENQWVDDLRITTTLAGPPVAPTIRTQPQSQTVNERDLVTLSVTPDGTPPFTFQWFSNNVAVLNATSRIYTIAAAPATANGSKYKVQVTGAAGSITSAEATLTVITDTAPPTILRVSGSRDFDSVTIVFSEPVTAASATNAANYALSGGLTVAVPTLVAPDTVRLTTGKQTEGATYTLTVNKIQDTASNPNTITPNTQVTVKAFVFSRGFATWERWQDRDGDTAPIDTFVANLLDPNFRPPDVVGTSIYLGSPRGVADNYGARASAYFVPPQTGSYVFFMASDDNGYLFLSTDENPANKKKIAAQPQWSDQNQWNDPDAVSTTEVRSDSYSAPEWPTGNTITLTAGKRYYIELVMQEGGGGDGCEAYYKLASDPDPANGTPPDTSGSVIGTFADPSSASISITITKQPQNVVILENASATFTVGATGSSGVLFYQWQRAAAGGGAFTDIPGANSSTYTTPPIPMSENGSRYRVAISAPGLTTNSAEATVTVQPDTVPPTLISAMRGFVDNARVTVVFSELMQAASVNAAANYKINNGITVSAAALAADGKSAVLTTSPIAKGTTNTLTVNGVRDLAGNQIAPNSQVVIGFERGALFVISGNDPATFNASDSIIKARLESRGYNVEVVGSPASDGAQATGKDIVVISSTVPSVNVTDKYKAVTVPVLEWEQALQDDFAMTTVGGTTDRGTTTGQTSIEIVNPAHPMAAGLPAGVVTVVTGPSEFAWGQPNTKAQVVATLVGSANACIYGYEKGALLTDDTPAPERRVLFFMTDNVAAALNADGFKLFDAALNWAQNLSVAPPQTLPPRITSATISAGRITIQWSNGGTLEYATSLNSPINWTPTANSSGTFSEPAVGTRFYRVKQSP